jgi:tripartite-type tricarboxylate transporter receptor subunit TctC
MLRIIRSTLVLALLAASIAAGSVMAQSYPTRTIKLVVAFAPGGVADIMGRLVAQFLQHKLGGHRHR